MVLFDVSFPRQKQADDAAAEATAIVAIGRALSTLPDPEARLRVLRWANERFSAPAAIGAETPAVAAAVVAADPMLSMDGVHAFFEPAPAPRETSVAPHHAAYEEIGDLFDEPALRVRTEMRVVARKEDPPAATASDDLRDLYEETVAQHDAELEAVVGDLYEQPAACDALPDEPFGDLYDESVMQYYAVAEEQVAVPHDEPTALVSEEPVGDLCEEPAEEARPELQAVACEDQSLDALVADFASALQSLTLQLQDASA
jgi:hypothetical protein